jgi:manganese/zinc/iron transport system permease protein
VPHSCDREEINVIDFDYTLTTVVLGGTLVGLLSGIFGVYAVLRKQSLLGDTISHSALPGIALVFLVSQVKHPLALILGAMVAGWLGTIIISSVSNKTRIKLDTIMAVVLAVFFGLGLALLSMIQKLPTANQAGLTKFLYGNASTMLRQDVHVMAGFATVAVIAVLLLWKEFKLATFDAEYAKSLGLPIRMLDMILLSLIVIAITIGLQMVGVVLMSAMIVAPAAAARQWTNRFGVMALLSAGFGMLASISGALLSSTVEKLPTGPTIVCIITSVFIVSILFAPTRGLLWQWLKRRISHGEIALNRILEELYWLSRNHDTLEHYHELRLLQAINHERIDSYISSLTRQKLVELSGTGGIRLTDAGLDRAQTAINETAGSEGQ